MRGSAFALILLTGCAQAQLGPSVFADSDGQISVPEFDYASTWRRIGPVDDSVQRVYVSPETADAYRRIGDFPDGAILVKEVRGGSGVTGWFVMVRDTTHRFPDNPNWAEGWGWAWVDAQNRHAHPSLTFVGNCRSCHVVVQGTHWVHVGEYHW